ncbi:MAG TPA: hypothetical protein VMN60_08845 [Longimicrobiales bacterium]|nr:hypothetical protein [Longimicrobiales bacterium]
MRKRAFVVGRATGRSTLLLFVGVTQPVNYSPIVGPWTVCAVVSTN